PQTVAFLTMAWPGVTAAAKQVWRRSCSTASRVLLRTAFFFQAEDGIRDFHVTGVQTCALPISDPTTAGHEQLALPYRVDAYWAEIGRASCRERVQISAAGGASRKRRKENVSSNCSAAPSAVEARTG